MRAKKLNKTIGDFITLKQLLQSVPLSERTIRNYVEKNKITAYKLNGKLIFNVLDIEAFLKRRRVGSHLTEPILKTGEDRVLELSKQLEKRLLAIARLTPEEAGIFSEARVMTDQAAQQFFAGRKRTTDGAYISNPRNDYED